MKPIKLPLIFGLALLCVFGHAQIRIEKRHHLKGYHFDYTRKRDRVKDIKDNSTESTRAAISVNEAFVEEPNTVKLPVISSPEILFADETKVAHVIGSKAVKTEVVKKSHKQGFFSSLRQGAGMILPLALFKKSEVKTVPPPAVNDMNGGFAIAGFIIGCVAILGLFGGGLFGLLAVVGLIFSILGLRSSRHTLALAGVILNAVVLALALLVVASFP